MTIEYNSEMKWNKINEMNYAQKLSSHFNKLEILLLQSKLKYENVLAFVDSYNF